MAGAVHQLQSFTASMAAAEDWQHHQGLSWENFFRDPSKWWDNRNSKRSPLQPDFRHKITREPLWINSPDNPSWVSDKLSLHGFVKDHQCIANTADDRLSSLLWECCKNKDWSGGARLHAELQKRGLSEKNYSDALIIMYAKCGKLQKAQALLDMNDIRSIIPWTALIASYARHGQGQNALDCYEQMQHKKITPNAVTYASILKACGRIGAINKGKKIHDEISRQGLLEHDIVLSGALVDMYVKCGALSLAQSVLEQLAFRNVILWSSLIAGFAEKGQGQKALECYDQMQHEGIPSNAVTYACILKASAAIGDVDTGKKIHNEIVWLGLLEQDIVLGGALVDMYAKCGALREAQCVLQKLPSANVVLWSALIKGYAEKEQGQEALECFEEMQQKGFSPDPITYVSILKACGSIGAINKGKQIHEEISRKALLEQNIVLGSALVDFYAKCGAFSQARSVIENLPSCDVFSWSALIAGYAQQGQGEQALQCFKQMQHKGIAPDAVTYLCIVKACAVIGAIDKGKRVHDEISRQRWLEQDMILGNALVDMYAKCGDLSEAKSVLMKLPSRNVVSWNALIAGYVQEGQGEQALNSFNQMQHEGILPDMVTFLCLLSLCSHLGLVEKGQALFDSMERKYGLMPDIDCFTCMVDLLGRAGHIIKAVEVIQKMHCSANSIIWLCLLSACQKWRDVLVGSWAFQQAVEQDKCNGAAYILMVNIYTAAGMPEEAKTVKALRIKNKAWKRPACSSWVSPNKVHEFSVGKAYMQK
ncbi:hypothetical protein GOP47_0004492 [Adiantum capillus-veneris]|uniref:Pentatricopeptide repeat-containing protein n=1 Tax=Adiantum capillus-veneris TaxID=13818 RepID=A0A9D4ZMW1_ADICA|nr:hypothetical protein GOP47_0004492 [Adiantum capillus-veneris]